MSSSTTSFRRYLAILCVSMMAVGTIAVVATEALVRFGVEPNHNIFQHVAFVKQVEAFCGAFGDSHTALGFAGTDKCANLGYPGESFDDTANKLALLSPDRLPQKIILQADPLMFSRRRLEAGPSFHMNYLTDTAESVIRILDPLHSPLLIRYWRTAVLKQGFSPVFTFHPNGWMAFDERWEQVSPSERKTKAVKEVDEQQPIPNFSTHTTAARFKNVLAQLRASGHDVCVVTYPMSLEFTTQARLNLSFSAALAFFKASARDAGANYIDMLDWREHDPVVFANSDHLNADGARAFTSDVLHACGFA